MLRRNLNFNLEPEELYLASPMPLIESSALDTGARNTVKILYTNWEGETSYRNIHPIDIKFRSSRWHGEPQWLLIVKDLDKEEMREFAMKDIKGWSPIL